MKIFITALILKEKSSEVSSESVGSESILNDSFCSESKAEPNRRRSLLLKLLS